MDVVSLAGVWAIVNSDVLCSNERRFNAHRSSMAGQCTLGVRM